MRRISRTLAVTASVALCAAACSGGGDTDGGDGTGGAPRDVPPVRGTEELVIWTDDFKFAAVNAVAQQFASDRSLTVGVQAVADPRASFITANAASNGPDVLVGAHDWIGVLAPDGAIDPLQLSAGDLAGFSESAVRATTYDGRLYGVPYQVEAPALYCNTDFAPGEFTTLDDAISAGQAAVDAGLVDIQLSLPVGNDGDVFHMQPIFTSAGGYLFGVDSEGNYDPTELGLTEPSGVSAAEKIASLGETGTSVLRRSIDGGNSVAQFAEENAACLISGPEALSDVRASGIPYSIQRIPGFAGGDPAEPFMRANAFYVASNGENKALAQEFVTRGVNNEAAMTMLFENDPRPPAMIAVRDAVEDPDTLTFAIAADEGAPVPTIPAMDAVWAPLGQAYSAMIGGADPEESITQAGQTIANAIAAS